MPTKSLYLLPQKTASSGRPKANVQAKQPQQTASTPTAHNVVEMALSYYATHIAISAAEIAQACEALRILHERTEAAEALFALQGERAAPPATANQRDLLAKLGYEGELHNCGHASRLIGELLGERRLIQKNSSHEKRGIGWEGSTQ